MDTLNRPVFSLRGPALGFLRRALNEARSPRSWFSSAARMLITTLGVGCTLTWTVSFWLVIGHFNDEHDLFIADGRLMWLQHHENHRRYARKYYDEEEGTWLGWGVSLRIPPVVSSYEFLSSVITLPSREVERYYFSAPSSLEALSLMGVRTYVPLGLPSLLLLLWSAVLWRYELTRWVARLLGFDSRPLCPACRYNLTGNMSGICPECGAPMADDLKERLN